MIWCIADVIFLNIRKQSIHPGIYVAIDLLIVVGLMSAAITQLVISATYWNNPYQSYLNPTCYAAVTLTIITRYIFTPLCLPRRKTGN
jgi:Na+/proline symporter